MKRASRVGIRVRMPRAEETSVVGQAVTLEAVEVEISAEAVEETLVEVVEETLVEVVEAEAISKRVSKSGGWMHFVHPTPAHLFRRVEFEQSLLCIRTWNLEPASTAPAC